MSANHEKGAEPDLQYANNDYDDLNAFNLGDEFTTGNFSPGHSRSATPAANAGTGDTYLPGVNMDLAGYPLSPHQVEGQGQDAWTGQRSNDFGSFQTSNEAAIGSQTQSDAFPPADLSRNASQSSQPHPFTAGIHTPSASGSEFTSPESTFASQAQESPAMQLAASSGGRNPAPPQAGPNDLVKPALIPTYVLISEEELDLYLQTKHGVALLSFFVGLALFDPATFQVRADGFLYRNRTSSSMQNHVCSEMRNGEFTEVPLIPDCASGAEHLTRKLAELLRSDTVPCRFALLTTPTRSLQELAPKLRNKGHQVYILHRESACIYDLTTIDAHYHVKTLLDFYLPSEETPARRRAGAMPSDIANILREPWVPRGDDGLLNFAHPLIKNRSTPHSKRLYSVISTAWIIMRDDPEGSLDFTRETFVDCVGENVLPPYTDVMAFLSAAVEKTLLLEMIDEDKGGRAAPFKYVPVEDMLTPLLHPEIVVGGALRLFQLAAHRYVPGPPLLSPSTPAQPTSQPNAED